MKISERRVAGGILNRGGISQRIIQIATEISKGTYKEAIEKAGQIKVLVDAASYDDYWEEKSLIGRYKEESILEDLIADRISRNKVISQVNPYKQ